MNIKRRFIALLAIIILIFSIFIFQIGVLIFSIETVGGEKFPRSAIADNGDVIFSVDIGPDHRLYRVHFYMLISGMSYIPDQNEPHISYDMGYFVGPSIDFCRFYVRNDEISSDCLI